jgi:ABC-type xylose transport system permease subunit
MIVKRIMFGVIALIWGIFAILAEQRLEETRSVRSMIETTASIFVYAGCMFVVLE